MYQQIFLKRKSLNQLIFRSLKLRLKRSGVLDLAQPQSPAQCYLVFFWALGPTRSTQISLKAQSRRPTQLGRIFRSRPKQKLHHVSSCKPPAKRVASPSTRPWFSSLIHFFSYQFSGEALHKHSVSPKFLDHFAKFLENEQCCKSSRF